jgi:hypothetical protein
MNESPILVLGFNRPEFTRLVFESLAKEKPKHILFAVDGPRLGVQNEIEKVKDVQNSISKIDWNCTIETRFRPYNLGLKTAVVDAVSWAISKYGQVVVLEDDAIPGPQFCLYMNNAMEKFKGDETVGHISGYNQVPMESLSEKNSLYRRSIYPESYAWGTWDRAWSLYEDDLSHVPLDGFESIFSKLVWQQYFGLARSELISTWAFRWIASLWRNNLDCVTPNVNLVNYVGHSGGTHTRSIPSAPEQKIGSIENLSQILGSKIDVKADNWTSSNIFRENFPGLVRLLIARGILNFEKKINLCKS